MLQKNKDLASEVQLGRMAIAASGGRLEDLMTTLGVQSDRRYVTGFLRNVPLEYHPTKPGAYYILVPIISPVHYEYTRSAQFNVGLGPPSVVRLRWSEHIDIPEPYATSQYPGPENYLKAFILRKRSPDDTGECLLELSVDGQQVWAVRRNNRRNYFEDEDAAAGDQKDVSSLDMEAEEQLLTAAGVQAWQDEEPDAIGGGPPEESCACRLPPRLLVWPPPGGGSSADGDDETIVEGEVAAGAWGDLSLGEYTLHRFIAGITRLLLARMAAGPHT